MVDFIRLNLNTLIGFSLFFLVGLSSYIAVIKAVPVEFKKYIRIVYIALFVLLGFSFFALTAKQASVNNVPRSTIDRSFTEESQQKYENSINQ